MTMLLQLLIFIGFSQSAQQQPRPAVIEGIVLNAGSGSPLQEAGVELIRVGANQSPRYTIATRVDGTFSFADVPPGDYRVSAAHPGFVRSEYGQKGPGGNGLTITVASGDNLKAIRIPLTEAATISGRVVDSSGRPVPNAQVQAFRFESLGALRLLNTARVAITNDRGEYRLFWLAPDEYVVMAMPIRGAIEDRLIKTNGDGYTVVNSVRPAAGVPILPPEDHGPLPYFYGGTTDPETAMKLQLKPADDIGGIDISIRPVPTFTVRGKLLNLSSHATTEEQARSIDDEVIQIRLEPRTPPTVRFRNEMPNGLVSVDPKKGTFEIRGVVPGSYWVYARIVDSRYDVRSQARAAADVSGKDTNDVVISFSQGVDVPLRVVLDNQQEGPALNRLVDSLRLWLTPADGGGGLPAEPAAGQPATFIVRNVPDGEYKVSFALIGEPFGAYFKTTRVDGIERRDSFRIDRIPNRAIEVVFGLGTGTITGFVTNSKLEGISDATVVAMGGHGTVYATSGPGGRFQIINVPPGKFVVYAWESIARYTWQDPAVMQRAAGRGTSIQVDDASIVNVNVIALPAEGAVK